MISALPISLFALSLRSNDSLASGVSGNNILYRCLNLLPSLPRSFSALSLAPSFKPVSRSFKTSFTLLPVICLADDNLKGFPNACSFTGMPATLYLVPCSVTSISTLVILIGMYLSAGSFLATLDGLVSLSGYPQKSTFNKNVAVI